LTAPLPCLQELHYNFLSYFRPVFYLRARDYSKSVPIAPFLVNYSGALFREYPGPWQVGSLTGARCVQQTQVSALAAYKAGVMTQG
jgi:hypothetical protein